MSDVIELNRREALTVGAGVGSLALVGSGTIPTSARAQTASDSVSGTVTDADGNPVENAWVLLDPHASDGSPVGDTVLATQTDLNGDYTFGSDDLYTGENYYHAYCRNGSDSDPQRSMENYPWILASVEAGIPGSAVAHYDAQSLSGFSDGDGVSTWTDELGNYDATGGSPIYRDSGINGNPSLEFDGTDDGFTNTSLSESQPNTILVAIEHSAGDRQVFDSADASSRHQIRQASSGWQMLAGDFLAGSSDTSVTLITAVFDGSNALLREDGVQTDSGNVGTDSLEGVSIGVSASGGNYWDGHIGEVLVCNERLSSSEIDTQEARMAERWGITLS